VASIADFGSDIVENGGGLDGMFDGIDNVYPVPVADQPTGVNPSGTADIQHPRGRRRQEPSKQLLGPKKLQPSMRRSSQPRCLEPGE
jgi:hypothetical protein